MNPNPYSNHNFSIIDSSQLKSDQTVECDYCIVGTGSGGGYAAELLAEKGHKVVMLEQGPFRTSDDFKMKEGEAYVTLYQEAASRLTKDKGIKILQGRSVGGGTTVNWTSSFRTPEYVLNHWKENFGTDKTVENMKPHFDAVAERFNMGKWDVPPNNNNTALEEGLRKMGVEPGHIPRNVKDCHNLGYCGMGCPVNAKQGTLITSIPGALKRGATLYHRLQVERLQHDGKNITSLEAMAQNTYCSGFTGIKVRVRAKKFILAAGGIGTPTIMMKSKLPDPHGLIGRRTFLHPVTATCAIFKDDIDGYYGAPQSIYSDHWLYKGRPEGKMGFKLEVPPLHPVLMSGALFGHGDYHSQLMKTLPNLQVNIALHRDGFHQDSQGGSVELRDDGSPVVDYPVTEHLKDSFRRSLKIMAEIQFEAGALKVHPLHQGAGMHTTLSSVKKEVDNLPMESGAVRIFSAHVMGGAPMGADERKSVVDLKGNFRGIVNLQILDGSLFPTSLGVNPMMSIMGLVRSLI